MLKQKPASSRHRSYVRQISAVHVATDQPIPLWPSHKTPPPETPSTTLLKNLRRLWYRSRPTSCLPEAARPPIRRLRERKKSINVWINNGTRVEKILAPPLLPVLTLGLGKTCPRSLASTVTRKSTTRGTALSSEKTYQKTSIGFVDLRSDD